MPPDPRPTPAEIIGELLTSHPEAPSLLAEASHCQALAACSAVITRVKFAAAQAARLAYEELRHRLEPRRRHPIHFGVGMLLLLIVSAGLAMLVLIELSGLLGGSTSALPALAATAVWLTVAWLAVIVVRQRRWALVAAVIGAALLLELLLVALHGLSPQPGWPAGSTHDHGSTVFGVLAGAFIVVLTAGAAVLMAHMEPASLLMARQRWHRGPVRLRGGGRDATGRCRGRRDRPGGLARPGPGQGGRDRGRRRAPRAGDRVPRRGPGGQRPPAAPARPVTYRTDRGSSPRTTGTLPSLCARWSVPSRARRDRPGPTLFGPGSPRFAIFPAIFAAR